MFQQNEGIYIMIKQIMLFELGPVFSATCLYFLRLHVHIILKCRTVMIQLKRTLFTLPKKRPFTSKRPNREAVTPPALLHPPSPETGDEVWRIGRSVYSECTPTLMWLLTTLVRCSLWSSGIPISSQMSFRWYSALFRHVTTSAASTSLRKKPERWS